MGYRTPATRTFLENTGVRTNTGGKGWCTGLGHCKYIARKWIKNPPHTHPVYHKYIQNFPANFIAVFPVQEMPSTFTVFQVM